MTKATISTIICLLFFVICASCSVNVGDQKEDEGEYIAPGEIDDDNDDVGAGSDVFCQKLVECEFGAELGVDNLEQCVAYWNGLEVGTQECIRNAANCEQLAVCLDLEVADDDTDSCDGCSLNDWCYESGDLDPENPCRICAGSEWIDNDEASCDDGIFCNGDDTCNGGACGVHQYEDGDQRCPSDGMYCNGEEFCDEQGNSCSRLDVPDCSDDGLYCNGDEFCDEDNDECGHSGDPCTDDGVFCNGSESCNEGSDSCDHSGNPCPVDDGIYCNGDETSACDEDNDECGHSGDPCTDDGVFCNGSEICNEESDSCDHSGNPCPVDDGIYCNGDETSACDEDNDECGHAGDPCTNDNIYCNGTESCNEGNSSCDHSGDPCPDDGNWCNGERYCVEASDSCAARNIPDCADDGLFCNGDEFCDEDNDECAHAGNPCPIDDGVFCNGDETSACDEGTDECGHEGNPCPVDDGLWCNGDETSVCNLGTDECEHTGNPCPIDDGLWCNGDETDECDEGTDECGHEGDPCPDDGLYCNGDESCNESDDICEHAGNPCPVDDGLWCNGDETGTCDEGADECGHEGNPCPVDDGLWCNGNETDECDEGTDECGHEGDPCVDPLVCNEEQDTCVTSTTTTTTTTATSTTSISTTTSTTTTVISTTTSTTTTRPGAGGPDSYGYTWNSAAEPFVWEDISDGVLGPAGHNRVSDSIDIGFNFAFYGILARSSTVHITTNGHLSFDGTTHPGVNCAGGFIFGYTGFWTDINTATNGDIYYKTVGAAPNRKFITQWAAVPAYDDDADEATFQVVLEEGTNDIVVYIQDGFDTAKSNLAIRGWEDGHYLSSYCEEPVVAQDRVTDFAVRFSYPDISVLNLTPKTQKGTGDLGDDVVYTLTVHNLTGADDVFDISCTGNTWVTNCPATIDLNNMERGTFEVTVTVPGDVNYDDTDDVNVEITDGVNNADATITSVACPGCLIDDECYEEDEVNPEKICEICNIALSYYEWSPNDGADCDDGVFCNGDDTCSNGACFTHAGDPCTDDGLYCNGDESCNENDDICEHSGNPCPIDDGLYCNGNETSACDEGTDECGHEGNPCPVDDGLWCNGDETDECTEASDECGHEGNPCNPLIEECNEVTDNCDSIPQFITITHGTFTMGSPDGTGADPEEPGRDSSEIQHEVTLTGDFEITKTEVTQGQFNILMNWNPSHFPGCGFGCPVEKLSWFDAVAYANELSADTGHANCYLLSDVLCEDGTNAESNYMNCMNDTQLGIESATIVLNGVSSVYECEGYRLLTEAEWEYAARAGTTTAYYSGANDPTEIEDCTASAPYDDNLALIGWYCANSGDATNNVGVKDPNAWGLYDTSGNVSEMVWDWYDTYPGDEIDPDGPESGSDRVNRSGGWETRPRYCRSADRGWYPPGDRNYDLGFRLARSLP